MSYAARWLPAAERSPMAMWIRSRNKDAIAGYVGQIDRILARDPSEQGESRNEAETIRLWFHRPLSVYYLVDEATKTVFVGRVKWVGL